MYPVQYGGAKPLKKVPSGYLLMGTKDGKTFFGNETDYTTDVIDAKMIFGYTFYETKNTIYYHEGVAIPAIKSINPKRL